MKIDITLTVTPEMVRAERESGKKELEGHLGTHFDVMDKDFPLDYTERRAVVFDVSAIRDRDIDVADIPLDKVCAEMFVAFCSGFGEEEEYGTHRYFKEHPQLSYELITALLDKGVSIIGVDFAGVRRGAEHTPTDQVCADRGVFVVENLRNLKALVGGENIVMHTYPMKRVGVTGLPCRVIAEV